MATDWLLLQEAALWSSEGAVAATDDARHKLAFGVGIGNALFVDDCLCACRELRPEVVELRLDVCYFVQRDGCSCLSFLTALAVAALDVAAEVLRQDVRMQDDVADFDEITKRLVAAHVA